MNRNILITGPSLADPGGVANYYNSVIPHLERLAEDEIQYLPIGSTHTPGRHRLWLDQHRLFQHLQRYRPELVHINPSLNYPSLIRDGLFATQAKARGAKLLVFFRGWDESVADAIDARWLWLFRRTLGRADAFVVLSAAIAARLLRWGVTAPIDVDTTVVADDFLEGFTFDAKCAEATQKDVVRVLFMSRLEREKGVFETIDAIIALAHRGYPVHLTIAGDGSVRSEVERTIAANPLAASHIEFVGYVRGEAKRALLSNSHIYCLPTYHGEGMPNALIEALAFGMPIVTCAAGGIGEMFKDGVMGYLVPAKNVEALQETLQKLVQDRHELARIGAANHRFAVENLLASQAAQRLKDRYEQLTSTP